MSIRTEFDGVFFDEGNVDGMTVVKDISTQLNSGFGQDQLKSLRDVKKAMAAVARENDCNIVSNFKFGQRNGSIWQQLWSVDNVLWYGSGTLGKLRG